MTNCPCCDNQLLRHIRGKNVYWFCRSCWQEMPELSLTNCSLFDASVRILVQAREYALTADRVNLARPGV